MARPCRGVEPDALAQLAHRPIFRSGVPERDAQVISRLCRVGTHRSCAFEMTERGGEVALLAQDETKQAVRVGVPIVQRERLGQLLACGGQLTAANRILGARVDLVGRARGR